MEVTTPSTLALVGSPPDPLAMAMSMLKTMVDHPEQAAALPGMYDLVRKMQEDQARERFGNAIAGFQLECPIIPKLSKADRYSFTAFDDLWARVRKPLSSRGIAVSFSAPKKDDKFFEMTCRLRVGGYSEDYPFAAPWPDLKAIAERQKITEPQAMGTVLAYYKRYSLSNSLNIVTGDEPDLDGTLNEGPLDQIETLNELLEALEGLKPPTNVADVVTVLGGKVPAGDRASWAHLPARQFWPAFRLMNRRLPKDRQWNEADVKKHLEGKSRSPHN